MSLTLNNVETEAQFPHDTPAGSVQGAMLRGGPAAIAEVDVYNNAAYLQLLVSPTGDRGQAQWVPELFLPPGHRTLVRRWIFGVRLRSAVEGSNARTTIELIAENETWLAFLLAGAGAYN